MTDQELVSDDNLEREQPAPVFFIGSALGEGKATSLTVDKTTTQINIRERIASLFGLGPKAPLTAGKAVTDTRALAVIKQGDGKLRWFARYSNAWEDRDHEILTEEAHKDYINWAYDTGTFPELWLWHTGGTRIGEADWLDFSNGFAHASGLIDNGRESVIEAISTKDIGVSHGFLSLQQGKYVSRYRTYEISVLPRDRAAVETSGFNVLDTTKENVMAFTEEKRKWLVEALGADAVAGLEKSTDAMAEQLKLLGTEYKETEDKKAEEATATSDGMKALAEQMAQITSGMVTLATAVAGIKQTADEAKTQAAKSTAELEEDSFVTKLAKAINGGTIVRPTESAANVQGEKATEPEGEVDFLTEMINKQLGGIVTRGSVGTAAVGSVQVTGTDGVQEVRD